LALQEGFFLLEDVSVNQTPTHSFFRSMLLFGKKDSVAVQTSITIREGDNYSAAFSALLKEYYLKL
jgi:tRNA1Val (adenine37-N6)-methyltransferase